MMRNIFHTKLSNPSTSSSSTSSTPHLSAKDSKKKSKVPIAFDTDHPHRDPSPPSPVKRKSPTKNTSSNNPKKDSRRGLLASNRKSTRHNTSGPSFSSSPTNPPRQSHSYDRNSHPLNLPPDELRRLSAVSMAAMGDPPTPMEMDNESSTPSAVPSSSPPPSSEPPVPGSFPSQNGVNGDTSPTPPPPKATPSPSTSQPEAPPPPPTVDPEVAKAAGNKHFKAKEYDKAIKEYTKGTPSRHVAM